jgi:hypothetical protein
MMFNTWPPWDLQHIPEAFYGWEPSPNEKETSEHYATHSISNQTLSHG